MEVKTQRLLRDLRLALSYGAGLVCLLVALLFVVIGSVVGAVAFLLLSLYALPQVRERLADVHEAANAELVVIGVLVFGTFAGAGLGVVTTPDPHEDPVREVTNPTPTPENDAGPAASSPTRTATASPTATPTRGMTPTPTDSDAGSPTPTAGVRRSPTPTPGDTIRAHVVRVVDGDTLRVRYDNGTEDTVRLLGVNAPEIRGENEPREWEGVPDTEDAKRCLREEGYRATDYVSSQVADDTVRLRFDDRTDRRDYDHDLLAYVHHGDVHVNYQLALQGNARVSARNFTQRRRFAEAESGAQNQGIGAWSCRNADGSQRWSSTPTPTPTSTSTPSPTPTSTPTPSGNQTPTPTPTSSPTPTPTPTPTEAPTPSSNGTNSSSEGTRNR